MAFGCYLNNPSNKIVNDSVVRAIALATGEDWQRTYIGLALQGFFLHDMPSSSAVWSSFLSQCGFKCHVISQDYQEDYTIEDFILNHPKGIFVLSCDDYLVTVIDGTYYDYQQSGNKTPQYYWQKED